jgi:glycosyltransferase involved in cell wall biosynthesis
VKITYTSTNIAWHYRYAREFERLGCLKAFVTGASRWSPRADLPEIGSKMVRRDFFQNLYLASLKMGAAESASSALATLSNRRIDRAALRPARDSDVFLFYRTTGLKTSRALHQERGRTLCVMEEVNSHVDVCHQLMKTEYETLGRGRYVSSFPDHEARLRAYEEADCILCPSSFVKRSFVERGFPEDKLIMVNFGFTFPEWSSPPLKHDAVFRVLYVGQLHFRKGLRYAVEAFRRLKHPNKEFLLVGPATKVTGLEGVALPEGVRFTGILKGAELEAAYASSSVFVLPTIEEGLALVQGEAMAAGLPLITTTHSGGEDLITDGQEGFIVPPADSDALLAALQKLADSGDLRDAMAEAARAKAKLLGGWDVAAAKLVDALGVARQQLGQTKAA